MLINNIGRILHNISLIIYYNILKTSSKIASWSNEHKKAYNDSLRYLNEPKYIKQDYEDPYDVDDYINVGERNRYGFPKIN